MSSVSEGRAPYKVGDETLETYYQVFGDLKEKSRRPLVVLHGGPGLDCTYLENFELLWTEYGVPVVLYDQVGGGRSTHLPHKGCEFWTPDFFSDELESLLVYLGIHESYHLFGHSWGGLLASYFVGTRRPSGLGKIIISNSPISLPLFAASENSLVQKLPKEYRDEILKHDRGEKSDEELCEKGMQMYAEQHICRLIPQPAPVKGVLETMSKEPTVTRCTIGLDLFIIPTGTLKDFTVAPHLPNIKEPVLLINGEHDMSQDLCVEPFFNLLPKVKWVHLKDTSHMPFYEIRDKFMKIIYDFIQE